MNQPPASRRGFFCSRWIGQGGVGLSKLAGRWIAASTRAFFTAVQ